MVSSSLRNAIVFGAYCTSTTSGFAPPSASARRRSSTALPSSSGGPSAHEPGRRGRPLDDPFAPSSSSVRPQPSAPPPRGPQRSFGEPPNVDLNGQIQDRQSNLSRQTPSVNDDPRPFDMDRRFSQRPRGNANDPYSQPRRAWWESSPNRDGRIQGGSRHTYHAPYDRDASHVFLESDGRPLDVEFELYDGPNNTPTKIKAYSEDGRMRPINTMVENPQKGQRSNTLSVRNVGPMEFPINAGVSSVGNRSGAMPAVGDAMMAPSGHRPGGLAGSEGAYVTESELMGFTRPASPSTAKGERVQGGALSTFPLDHSVEAVQVTITTDGLPMMAKVELWGTSSHIKQVAEIYNDNGQTRPFATIIDVPGGSNTIAVYNEGPMEYPITVVVEPVARTEGWDGRDEKFGGTLAPW